MNNKNKGYQKDIKKSWHNKEEVIACPSGTNLTLEQYKDRINIGFDERIRTAKEQYEKISHWTTLMGEDLRKTVRDKLMWEVKFDEGGNLIPLEKAIVKLEEDRRRCLSRYMYTKWGGYIKRLIHKDNQKFVYNTGGSGRWNIKKVRIPSMKRSKATWKKFYELFPYYKEHFNELNNKNGIKLKKV